MSPRNEEVTAAVIYDRFQGLIAAGFLGRGERLPTVRQTAADLGVAVATAARAYKQLESDGLVTTRVGAGTRVADSASPVDKSVVDRARAFAAHARSRGVDLDQAVSVLRSVWAAEE